MAKRNMNPAKGVRQIARLEDIPNVGPAVAGDLCPLGITSTHLLIPQMEGAIRLQLEQREVIVSGFNRSQQQNECDLNTMLYTPEIERVYDEDVPFALRGLLVEQLGSNLRNLMAHGMLSAAELHSNLSLFLCGFTLRRNVPRRRHDVV